LDKGKKGSGMLKKRKAEVFCTCTTDLHESDILGGEGEPYKKSRQINLPK
jgi:hypothetical protein